MVDASTVLCLIRNEPGADAVKAVLADSSISAVNLSEVIAKMADLGMDADLIDAVLGPLQLPAIPFDAAQARIAGLMRPATRPLGLSLGDRACPRAGGAIGRHGDDDRSVLANLGGSIEGRAGALIRAPRGGHSDRDLVRSAPNHPPPSSLNRDHTESSPRQRKVPQPI